MARWDVSTWHTWAKRLDSGAFFEAVRERPEILPAYTRQYRSEELNVAEKEVIPRAARLVHELLLERPPQRPSVEVVDLGCGEAALAGELRSLPRPEGSRLEVVSVDAAPLAEGVEVHNLAALPPSWTGRFDAAVLCRALWGKDYDRALAEARRALRQSPRSFLLVVEPFKRWWGRERPAENALLAALRRAGFRVDFGRSRDVEPRPVEVGSATVRGFFQYVVARLELSSSSGERARVTSDPLTTSRSLSAEL